MVAESVLKSDKMKTILQDYYHCLTSQVDSLFDKKKTQLSILKFYDLHNISGVIECLEVAEQIALGVLLEYVMITQKIRLPNICFPKSRKHEYFMQIDASTRKSLELTRKNDSEYQGSLLSVINHTVSAQGSRLLHSSFSAPLCDQQLINERLDNVEFFVERQHLAEVLRTEIKQMPDLERAMSRILMKRGGPKDLLLIRQGLGALALWIIYYLKNK